MCAMSLSPDRVNVPHSDRLTACAAVRFLYTFHLEPQAIKAELMAALQLVIAVVHPVAYIAFLHARHVLGLPICNTGTCGDLYSKSLAVFCRFLLSRSPFLGSGRIHQKGQETEDSAVTCASCNWHVNPKDVFMYQNPRIRTRQINWHEV